MFPVNIELLSLFAPILTGNIKLKCLKCGGEFKEASDFNLMFPVNIGANKDKSSIAYLRGETAQLIFANFKKVAENSRLKLPFGIAQIEKPFRNEIAPRNFLFRCRQFEQIEIEYFVNPKEKCHYKFGKESILVYSAEMQEKNKKPVKIKFKEAYEKGIIKTDWHAYWMEKEFL